MNSWFRSWHGAPTDNKWLVIAKRANVAPGMVSAVFWALMDYASQVDDRGDVTGFDTETYALWAGWEEDDVTAVIDAMKGKGIIAADGRLSAWEKRQPKREDDSSERVRALRARKKAETVSVTQCNADVTQCNAPDTDTDTDTTTYGSAVAERDSSPLYQRFRTLVEQLKADKNKQAKLREIYVLCFGEESAPDYGYFGTAAKRVGGAGRLAELMFELITSPPTGDILAYIMQAEADRKARKKQYGGNREIETVMFTNGHGDIYE